MKTSRKSFYRISAVVVFFIAGLLIIFLVWQYQVNQSVLISEEQAIQNAIEACNPSYGLQPVVELPRISGDVRAFG
jgi:hypothetical protein